MNNKFLKVVLTGVFVLFMMFTSNVKGQYITNGDMEIGPGGADMVPDDWVIISASPDHCDSFSGTCVIPYAIPVPSPQGGKWTRFYHNDILVPHNETFGQFLTTPLTPGQDYVLTFYATYSKLNSSVTASPSTIAVGFSTGQPVLIGLSDPDAVSMTTPEEWVLHTYNFTASAAHDFISFMKVNDDEDNACYIDDVKLVEANTNLSIVGNQSICAGETTTLTAVNDFNVAWADSLSPGITLSSNTSIMVSPIVTTTYEITGTSETVYYTVNVTPVPDLDLGNDTTFCLGDDYVIVPNISNNIVWQDGTNSVLYVANVSGAYSATVTVDGCSATDFITLTDIVNPVVELGSDFILCLGRSFTFDVENPGSTYLWNDGSTAPEYTVNKAGIYAVAVTNSCGMATDAINVEIKDCSCHIYTPNTISPDHDGLNDIFKVYADCEFLYYDLTVFDRNGTIVFESQDPTEPWNGGKLGFLAPETLYNFTLDYRFPNFSLENLRGFVTILR